MDCELLYPYALLSFCHLYCSVRLSAATGLSFGRHRVFCDGVAVRRGYADAEIEAVFAKYDADGDSGLNLSEQGRMQRDLEDEKVGYLDVIPCVVLAIVFTV